jgi:putative FmdB family regulatory protein
VPLYEYRCKKCQHVFEKIQQFSDPPVKKCPQCGGAVEQLISAPAVQFKGSGWYVTDYGRSGGSGANKPSSNSATATSSDSDGAKSAGKTDKAEKTTAKKETKSE